MKDALFHGDIVNTNRIIYTPSEFAKASLLHIQEIGTLQATKPHTSKRDHLPSYLFFIVSSGSGKLLYDGCEYELKEGNCVYIDTRRSYSHTTTNDLWSLSWVHFDGPTAANIYQKYKDRGGLPTFFASNLQLYLSKFNSLYEIASSQSYIRDMEINTDLSSILALLMADSWCPNTSPQGSKKISLVEVKKYLNENYSQRIALNDVAQYFNINKYYLTRIFKKQFGISIMEYLLNVRITEAKHLLRFSPLSTDEIGIRTGIGDAYYFSRVFKKTEGINASEFRKQWG